MHELSVNYKFVNKDKKDEKEIDQRQDAVMTDAKQMFSGRGCNR